MRALTFRRSAREWPSWFTGLIISCLLFCAASARAQSVSLSWSPGPSGGTTGYYLYFGKSSGNYSTKLDVGDNTLVTLSGLTVGQTYYFVVTAYNSARIESVPSNVASFVVPTVPSTLSPQLAAVTPSSGPPGAQVFIYGANFNTTTGVQFAGVSAPFTLSSDGCLVATVPAGATTGLLNVNTANGAVNFHFVVTPASPPANDNFNNAQILTGVTAMALTNTTGATKQSGEPNHAGNAGGSSVWYRWTAPATGTWSLDTIGSTFATLLGVYTGTAINSLSPVASTTNNALTFNAVAGVTYQIAVDGFNGAAGNMVLHLAAARAASTTVYSSDFEVGSGFYASSPLAGQQGWLSQGSASTGLKNNFFQGYGQQGYVGFLSTVPTSSTLLYVPLNYAVNTNASPVIQFSVMMQISASSQSPYNNTFGWVVRNASGQELFRISFDDYAKTISYTLNNGAGPVYTPLTLNNTVVYELAVIMDFGRNTWSASLSGAPLASGQPITTTGAALTLGDIDASEVFRSSSLSGTDAMLFDDYLVTAGSELAPTVLRGPVSQTVSAGNTAVLAAMVSGAAPLSWQWAVNNSLILDATNSTLVLTGVTASQAGNYSFTVSNPYGSASGAATVTVATPPPKSLFAAPVSLGASGALLNLNVAAGNYYSFQVSSNLQTWTTLETFCAMSTNALCFDPAAATAPRRFYRLVSP